MYYSQGRFGEAKENFSEAIEIDNNTLSKELLVSCCSFKFSGYYILRYEDGGTSVSSFKSISLDADLETLQVLNVFVKLKIGIESIPEAINISAEIKNVLDNNYSNDPRTDKNLAN